MSVAFLKVLQQGCDYLATENECSLVFIASILTILQTRTELVFVLFWALLLLAICVHPCVLESKNTNRFLASLVWICVRAHALICRCLRENVCAAPGYLSV